MNVDPDGYWVWIAINAGFVAYDGYKAGGNWKEVGWVVASNYVKPLTIFLGNGEVQMIASSLGQRK